MSADLILFLVDGLQGPTYHDEEVANQLRQFNKPVFLVINKMDLEEHQEKVEDFSYLGFKKNIFVSAEHGRGMDFLERQIEKAIGFTGKDNEP